MRFLKKYTKESILAPLFKMLEAMFDLFVPMVVAQMINVGIGQQDTGVIIRSALLLVGLAGVGLLCSFVAQFFAAKAATGTATKLRHELFAHIQKLGASEVDTIGASTLITRMTSDINQVQSGLNLFLRLFLRSPFIVIGAMVMAFTINAKIALIFVATIPVLSLIVFGMMRYTSPNYKKIQGKLDTVTKVTRENLSGVRVVRAFGNEDMETKRFEDANEDLVNHQVRVSRISSLLNPMTYVVVNLGIVAILYTGAGAVGGGLLLSGNVIALVNYMSQILVELVKLADLIVSISRANASLSRVENVLDTVPVMTFTGTKIANASNDIAVKFDHVSLQYAGAGSESLTDITFTAKRGEIIGVIGGTGSGKSSVVSLIPRFYDATSGEVTVLGSTVKEWRRDQLRCSVATVMQRAQLFSGTIRSNLCLGRENVTDEELWAALEMAQAADFVRSKPEQLDEKVEQGGRNLSGGQKQRLTIARALVMKPQILILDDSASALDFATDAALRKALRSLPKETTTFIVSQRTSSLAHADQILVMEDGRLADAGTHQQLLERCGVYREIYESQFRKEEAHA